MGKEEVLKLLAEVGSVEAGAVRGFAWDVADGDARFDFPPGTKPEVVFGFWKQQKEKAEAAAQPPGAPGVLKSFLSKLKERHINKPPDGVITRLITHYGNALTLAASADAPPEAALDLYQAVQNMPGTNTVCAIAEDLKIAINGPLRDSHPYVVTAVELDTGKLAIVKFLHTHEAHEEEASKAELFAVKELGLENPMAPLVKTRVLDFNLTASDAVLLRVGLGPRKLLLMPWLASDLTSLPQLTCKLIAQGAMRMAEALEFMHGRKLVHMDVKPKNIFTDHKGQWFLGDFGASLLCDKTVPHGIKTVYPGVLPTKASPVIDWRLLVVTVAILLEKGNWKAIIESGTPVPAKVKAVCDSHRQQSSDMEQVMERLFANADWEHI